MVFINLFLFCSGKNVNANPYGSMPSMNTVNPSAFNPSVLLGPGGVGGGGSMNPAGKIDNKRRNKGGM